MDDAELHNDLDPVEFMRALMKLSPEDARRARESARRESAERRAHWCPERDAGEVQTG